MNEVNYWEKLTTLPKGVVKEQGRFKGEYHIRISYVYGVWFIEYVYSKPLYGGEEPTYPDIFIGDTLREAVNKASNFFDVNLGKYKLLDKYERSKHNNQRSEVRCGGNDTRRK